MRATINDRNFTFIRSVSGLYGRQRATETECECVEERMRISECCAREGEGL